MRESALPVQIFIKEGPVIIRSLNGNGINAQYDMGSDVVASESFPPTVGSAFYRLSLEKLVAQATEVRRVEAELIKSLERLAAAWPFSGGSFMILEEHEVVRTPCYESNAEKVESELYTREDTRLVSASISGSLEASAIYRQPPLAIAALLAKAMRDDLRLEKLLGYYQRAWVEYYSRHRTERSSWFIDLYKVLDVFREIYGKKRVKLYLNGGNGDLSLFETILNNNDLRHAEISGSAPVVGRGDVDRVYQIARRWIQAYLERQRLPVVSF